VFCLGLALNDFSGIVLKSNPRGSTLVLFVSARISEAGGFSADLEVRSINRQTGLFNYRNWMCTYDLIVVTFVWLL